MCKEENVGFLFSLSVGWEFDLTHILQWFSLATIIADGLEGNFLV